MSEPLTKDKINKECDESCTEDTETVHLKDLKSALEEFERLCKEDISKERGRGESVKVYFGKHKGLIFAIDNMRKSFPAIYEQPSGCEVKGDE